MTPELRGSIAQRARDLQIHLNRGRHDVLAEANSAKHLFEEAKDETRTRWLNLELGGYEGHRAQPLHEILGVPAVSRLAAHVAAYRTQRCWYQDSTGGQKELRHFFGQSLAALVRSRDDVDALPREAPLRLFFSSPDGHPHEPDNGTFDRDVFDRVLAGFIAALHLQLGDLATS